MIKRQRRSDIYEGLPSLDEKEQELIGQSTVLTHIADKIIQADKSYQNLYEGKFLDNYTISNAGHEQLKELMVTFLRMEGFEVVDTEVTLHDFPKRYRADVVGYKNNEIHTVVEIGKITDPAKMQLFHQTYPRFIWLPFIPVIDISKIKEMIDSASLFPQELREVRDQLGNLKAELKMTCSDILSKHRKSIAASQQHLDTLREKISALEIEEKTMRQKLSDTRSMIVEQLDERIKIFDHPN